MPVPIGTWAASQAMSPSRKRTQPCEAAVPTGAVSVPRACSATWPCPPSKRFSTREKAEVDVFRLHEHGLWATMQQD